MAQQFPDMVGAERVVGSYTAPSGQQFWTSTYRKEETVEIGGTTLQVLKTIVISVNKETGHTEVATSY